MPDNTPAPALVLGSTSRYRRELLERLGLPFEVRAPDVDETPQAGETPLALAARLALAKAQAVAATFGGGKADSARDVVVIGSDQVADLQGQPLGKPGTHQRATEQLRAMRGHTVLFHTAVCVVRPATGQVEQAVDTVQVRMRHLSDQDIETYLRLEQPYDCAGSAKAEGLGIALLERITSDDPTALIGLPLITVTRLLRAVGLDVLAGR
ncbi:MAG TPA: septum formation inhibitor Maf [Candidatus Aquabacterium excrementipullorum]|nr:septum formation inhibitor Maf [Candidatus Aquabacterium excrementipullorum]